MPRPPQKWPHKALGNLEETQANLLSIEDVARRAQEALNNNHYMEVMMLLSDVRVTAIKGVGHLVRARVGNYEQEEQ